MLSFRSFTYVQAPIVPRSAQVRHPVRRRFGTRSLSFLLQDGGSRLVDERDDFIEERALHVLVGAEERLPGVPEAGGVPTLAFYCQGAGGIESSLNFLTVREIGGSATVEYRFDRKKTQEANSSVFMHTEAYGAIEREVKSALPMPPRCSSRPAPPAA